MKVLVVGGTGPTGVPLVNQLLSAGFDVAIFHTGAHAADFVAPVERLIGNPRDEVSIAEVLGSRTWDIAICTSGRLRALATALAGRTGRLVGISGQPVYDGSLRPTPAGVLPVPVPEWAPRQRDAANYTGKVAAGEDQLFRQHGEGDFEAVIVRYPGIYGPRAPLSHEWPIVRRILDGRKVILLPHGGATYFQRGFADNVAHLVFLAATRSEASGLAFNAGDERVIPARRVAEVIAEELEITVELLDVPSELCAGVFPLAERSTIVLDMSRARALLGYRDVTDVEAATRSTARWLAEHPPRDGEVSPQALGRVDYEREDRLIAAWRSAWSELQAGASEANSSM